MKKALKSAIVLSGVTLVAGGIMFAGAGSSNALSSDYGDNSNDSSYSQPGGESGSGIGGTGADASAGEIPQDNYDAVTNFATSNSPVNLSVNYANNPAGNGLKYQGYGTATDANNGRVTFSPSVARDWNTQPDLKNLAVHEIGHAASYYCVDQYKGPVFKGNDEAWATSYAWSRGYTGQGSGTIYGTPTNEMVAEARNCQ